MSFAHVDSLDALRQLKTALWKFSESANQSLSEADADLQRTLNWLEHEARSYWQGQIQRRTQEMTQAKQARDAKKFLRRRDGSTPSAIEEEKALSRARHRLDDAQAKLEAVRRSSQILQREALQYRGLIQRFVLAVQMELPAAAGHLESLIRSLETYTAVEELAGSTATGEATSQTESGASMARPEPADRVPGPAAAPAIGAQPPRTEER